MARGTLRAERDAVQGGRAGSTGSCAHVSVSAGSWEGHLRGISLPLPSRGRSGAQRSLSCFIPPWAGLPFALSGQGGGVPGMREQALCCAQSSPCTHSRSKGEGRPARSARITSVLLALVPVDHRGDEQQPRHTHDAGPGSRSPSGEDGLGLASCELYVLPRPVLFPPWTEQRRTHLRNQVMEPAPPAVVKMTRIGT